MNENYLMQWVKDNTIDGKVDAEKLLVEIEKVKKYNFNVKLALLPKHHATNNPTPI
jgi:hypothetical protein